MIFSLNCRLQQGTGSQRRTTSFHQHLYIYRDKHRERVIERKTHAIKNASPALTGSHDPVRVCEPPARRCKTTVASSLDTLPLPICFCWRCGLFEESHREMFAAFRVLAESVPRPVKGGATCRQIRRGRCVKLAAKVCIIFPVSKFLFALIITDMYFHSVDVVSSSGNWLLDIAHRCSSGNDTMRSPFELHRGTKLLPAEVDPAF